MFTLCQILLLYIWTSVTYARNLILTPQTTKDIRDPKYLPEFDMAVMQRSALPDQNFISVFLTFYKCALWYEILASFTNKVRRTGNPEKGAITMWYLMGHSASGQRTWGQLKEPRSWLPTVTTGNGRLAPQHFQLYGPRCLTGLYCGTLQMRSTRIQAPSKKRRISHRDRGRVWAQDRAKRLQNITSPTTY